MNGFARWKEGISPKYEKRNMAFGGRSPKSNGMKNVLIIGASGGIGQAMTAALHQAGVQVDSLSRSEDGLDITDEASVEHHLSRLTHNYDLIFVATGALEVGAYKPEKSIAALSAQGMADQFAINAIGPALVLKHSRHLMPKTERCVVAVLSARVGSIGDNNIGGWTGYRAAKAALNQIVHTAAIEFKRTHKGVICVALHPGTVATDFTAKYAGRHKTVSPQQAAQNLHRVMQGLTSDQSGQFFDYAGEAIQW